MILIRIAIKVMVLILVEIRVWRKPRQLKLIHRIIRLIIVQHRAQKNLGVPHQRRQIIGLQN